MWYRVRRGVSSLVSVDWTGRPIWCLARTIFPSRNLRCGFCSLAGLSGTISVGGLQMYFRSLSTGYVVAWFIWLDLRDCSVVYRGVSLLCDSPRLVATYASAYQVLLSM